MLPLVSHPSYSFDFPAKHRFPMEKFGLLLDYLKAGNIANDNNLFRPGRASDRLLQIGHCPQYLERFILNSQSPAELRRMGLPWSESLVKRTLISPNGTFLTALLALDNGIACHLAGGTHHAHYDFASGFCIMNDLAIAARSLVALGKAKRVLIVDCDVHQGDGTAAILEFDAAIFTFSLHCEKNFPVRKAKSNLDVGLAVGTEDTEYLTVLENHLNGLIDLFRPDFVFYDAGVDIYKHDPLGLLNISLAGIRERDKLVLETCVAHNLPVATVIGGGYYDDLSFTGDASKALAKRHAIVVEEAFNLMCR